MKSIPSSAHVSHPADKVVLLSDNTKDTLMIRMMLADIKHRPYELIVTTSESQCEELLKNTDVSLLIVDLALNEGNGLSSIQNLKPLAHHMPIVALTNRENQADALEALKQGAQEFLVKGKLDANLLHRVFQYSIERHRVMEELLSKNQELTKLNQLKSEFVSTVSHELRTPLTVAMSAANNLIDGAFGGLTDDQMKWLKKIQANTLRLQEMIDDILDLSKLQSGKSQIRLQPVHLNRLLVTAVENLQALGKPKQIPIKLCEPVPEAVVMADASRLEQVLNNLIANAVKFTPVGGFVNIKLEIKNSLAVIGVEDNGPGIAAENLGMIFERFRQVRQDSSAQGSTQGIGLGLAICKEIMTQHDGRIWAESELGHGSKFLFEMPISRQKIDNTRNNNHV